MPLPPPVIKIVLLVSFIILSSLGRRPTESRNGGRCPDAPWSCRWRRLQLLLDRSLSQRADPIFKPLCLHHHHLAVAGAERNSRHTLKGGEEMDRESP